MARLWIVAVLALGTGIVLLATLGQGEDALPATPEVRGGAPGPLLEGSGTGGVGETAPPSAAAAITGRVTRAGGPVVATVEVRSAEELSDAARSLVSRCESDDSGEFRTEAVPDGRYEVTAIARDGARGFRTVEVLAGVATRVDVALSPWRHSLSGRAAHTDGRPHRGTVVARLASPRSVDSWFPRPILASASTESDGSFEFHGLPPGAVALGAAGGRAEMLVFAVPQAGPVLLVLPDEAPVRRAGDGERAGSMSGRVLREDGEVLAGVRVRALTPTGTRETTTRSDGRYAFGDVRPGTSLVYVADEEWISRETHAARMSGLRYDPFQVEVRGDAEVVRDLVAVPAGALRGRVLDEDGSPCAQAAVVPVDLIWGYSSREAAAVRTDGDGSFTLRGLVPGFTYAVVARASGGRAAHAEADAQVGSTAEVVLRLKVPPGMDVRVVDAETGKPIEGAILLLRASCVQSAEDCTLGEFAEEPPAAWFTDAEGRARVTPMWGDRWVDVCAPGYQVEGKRREGLPKGAPNPTTLVFSLVKGRAIAGRVVLPPGVSTLEGLEIRGEGCVGLVGGEGRFVGSGFPPGAHQVWARLRRGKSEWSGSAEVETGTLDAEIRLELEPEERAPEDPLNVVPLGPDGKALEGCSLLATFVYADGSVATASAPIGRPPSVASVREIWVLAAARRSASAGSAPTLAGPFAPDANRLEVQLRPARTLRGRVSGPEGSGLRGVLVEAYPIGGPTGISLGSNAHASSRTDDDGAYLLERLGDFAYRIEFAGPPELACPPPLEVAPRDEPRPVRFEVSDRVSLRVLDENGRPMSEGYVEAGWPDRDGKRIDTASTGSIGADGLCVLEGLSGRSTYSLVVTGRNDAGRWVGTFAGWSPRRSEVRLVRAVTLKGRVHDDSGAPVLLDAVMHRSAGGVWREASFPVGADGRFSIDEVPEGVVEVRYRTRSGRLSPARSVSTADEVDLQIGP